MSKIAIVDLLFNWPPEGGARTDVKEVATRLAQKHQVRLFVPDYDKYFPRGQVKGELNLEIERIPFNTWSFTRWNVNRRFLKALEAYSPDKVIVTDGWYFKPPLIRALKDFKPIVRYYAYEGLCLHRHGIFYRYKYGRICEKDYLLGGLKDFFVCSKCMLGFLKATRCSYFGQEYLFSGAWLPSYRKVVEEALSCASTVIVYNRFIADRVRRYCDDVRIVPSGVDPDLFPELPQTGNHEPVIGMVGRVADPLKGRDLLFKAIDILRKKRTDFEAWLTVTPDMGFIPAGYHLVPWQTQENLHKVYRHLDICVVPSLWPEPFGIVAVEAMACQRPLVATRVGGLQEIVVDGETGFLVDPSDPQMLADRLEQLLDDPELRRSMGLKGRERVLNEFTWDHIVQKHYLPLLEQNQ